MTEPVVEMHKGQSFDDFLKEQGTYEETTARAVKRVVAWQLRHFMDAKKVTKAEMARRLKTSRSQVDRLLDPENDAITIAVLARAANAIGRHIRIELS